MNVVERYLLLALRLGRHIDGFVDFYYGPAGLAERAQAEEPVAPALLAEEGRLIAGSLSSLADAQRERWFTAQLEGLVTVAERLDGKAIPYEEEVRRCFGVNLDPATEDELAEAHERLGELLPGGVPLSERYQAWRHERDVPSQALLPALQAVATGLRGRTDTLFGLPEGEAVDFELVTGEPWGAFNDYLGGRRSRVSINVDFPLRAELLPILVSHEAYPGHHTELALKEALLVDSEGHLEEAIAPVGTPQSLMNEGVASYALDILGEDAQSACSEILADFGVGYDVALVREVDRAEKPMRRLGDTAAYLVHVEARDPDEVGRFIEKWSLLPADEADRLVAFVTHPAWRSYVAVYEAGRRLVEAWTGGQAALFRRLLTEQLTTADLLLPPR